MKLKDLMPNPGNPRKITDEKLKMLEKSLDEFGNLDGFIFNETTRRLAGGHQRQKVLPPDSEVWIEEHYTEPTRTGTTAIGYVVVDGEKHPYRQVRWDEMREKAANIAANQHGGEFEPKALADWLIELDHANYDLSLTGHTAEEIEDIVAPWRTMPEGEGEDEVPAVPVEPKTKRGELWLLGDHRLLCGDATSKEDVERLMGGEKADMVFTDPPYGIGYEYVGHDDSDSKQNEKLVAQAFSNHDCGKVWTPGLMNLARDVRRFGDAKICVWYKKFAQAGSGLGGASTWEPVLVLSPTARSLPNDVLTVMTERESVNGISLRELHSCPKPVNLYEQLLNGLSRFNDKIFEPFCGSGSTLIACEKTKRRCFGMEIAPEYCDVILTRWATFTGRDPEREDGMKWSVLKSLQGAS